MGEAEATEEVPPVKTYTLTTIEQLVKVGTTLWNCWFRGHSKVHGNLTPRLFRFPYSRLQAPHLVEAERTVTAEFRNRAPALGKVPGEEDDLSWLFLMQHHGVPTRLLDWSENVLVAGYFAVAKHLEEDGEVWAMSPLALNQKLGLQGMPLRSAEELQYLYREPFEAREELVERLGLLRAPGSPLALLPKVDFLRLRCQHAAFTLHPYPRPGVKGIKDILTTEHVLVRYIIPAEKKRRLTRHLLPLGVNRSTLFPDFDGLGQFLTYMEDHRAAWGAVEAIATSVRPNVPQPPECDGPWAGGKGTIAEQQAQEGGGD